MYSNLRVVTDSVNKKNAPMQVNNTSGHTGVTKAANGRWVAQIGSDGVAINIGSFIDKDHAVLARLCAELLYDFHENHGNRGYII